LTNQASKVRHPTVSVPDSECGNLSKEERDNKNVSDRKKVA
jgi:hypothetical protein